MIVIDYKINRIEFHLNIFEVSRLSILDSPQAADVISKVEKSKDDTISSVKLVQLQQGSRVTLQKDNLQNKELQQAKESQAADAMSSAGKTSEFCPILIVFELFFTVIV